MKIAEDMRPGVEHQTKWGELVILEYNDSNDVMVRFTDTWFETSTRSSQIRSGQVKDFMKPSVLGVGYIGNGIYSTKEHKDAHKKWEKMLERCYSDKFHVRNKTYKGCEVCEEWQDFQNFAEWYYDNLPGDGDYELDKDVNSGGVLGKIYSPETCALISKAENIQHRFSKEWELISPNGELVRVKNLNKFARDNNLTDANLRHVISGKRRMHKGWTKPEARNGEV